MGARAEEWCAGAAPCTGLRPTVEGCLGRLLLLCAAFGRALGSVVRVLGTAPDGLGAFCGLLERRAVCCVLHGNSVERWTCCPRLQPQKVCVCVCVGGRMGL